MFDTKIITVWERFNEDRNQWEHNHISDGYEENELTPIPKGKLQEKNWKKGKWRKFKARLEGMKVVMEGE